MADLNGDGETNHAEEAAEAMETADVERTEDYQKLIDYGIDKGVAGELDKIYQTGWFLFSFILAKFYSLYFGVKVN